MVLIKKIKITLLFLSLLICVGCSGGSSFNFDDNLLSPRAAFGNDIHPAFYAFDIAPPDGIAEGWLATYDTGAMAYQNDSVGGNNWLATQYQGTLGGEQVGQHHAVTWRGDGTYEVTAIADDGLGNNFIETWSSATNSWVSSAYGLTVKGATPSYKSCDIAFYQRGGLPNSGNYITGMAWDGLGLLFTVDSLNGGTWNEAMGGAISCTDYYSLTRDFQLFYDCEGFSNDSGGGFLDVFVKSQFLSSVSSWVPSTSIYTPKVISDIQNNKFMFNMQGALVCPSTPTNLIEYYYWGEIDDWYSVNGFGGSPPVPQSGFIDAGSVSVPPDPNYHIYSYDVCANIPIQNGSGDNTLHLLIWGKSEIAGAPFDVTLSLQYWRYTEGGRWQGAEVYSWVYSGVVIPDMEALVLNTFSGAFPQIGIDNQNNIIIYFLQAIPNIPAPSSPYRDVRRLELNNVFAGNYDKWDVAANWLPLVTNIDGTNSDVKWVIAPDNFANGY